MAEEAGDAKIDQLDAAGTREHDIAGFHISENHWWLLTVQVLQHIAQLPGPTQHAGFRKWPFITLQQVFERVAVNIFHHQEMALTLGKEIGEGWKIGMVQTRKNPGLRQEILNGLGLLIGGHRGEAHLLDGTDTSPPGVPRLIHSGHAPMSNRAHNDVAPVQQGTWV